MINICIGQSVSADYPLGNNRIIGALLVGSTLHIKVSINYYLRCSLYCIGLTWLFLYIVKELLGALMIWRKI